MSSNPNQSFYVKKSVSSASFPATADVSLTFLSTGLMMLNEGTSVIEFSFDGTTVHGEMDSSLSSAGLSFDNRGVSFIWFRLKSGSTSNVDIFAWSKN